MCNCVLEKENDACGGNRAGLGGTEAGPIVGSDLMGLVPGPRGSLNQM